MASLYDEKVLGAKERLALARKLQEQGDNVAAGQMVSGWYVPNTGGAITGAVKNLIGGYQEGKAQEDLDKAEREKTAATIRGLNSMGMEAPPEMALQAGTPEQKPAWYEKAGAYLTGGEQPQSVPAQPMAQNVAKGVSPEDIDRQSLAMSVVNPEVGAMAQTIGNNQANRESRRIAAQDSSDLRRWMLSQTEAGKNTRQDKNIGFQGEQGDLNRQNRVDIHMMPSPNSGGTPSYSPVNLPDGSVGIIDHRTGNIKPYSPAGGALSTSSGSTREEKIAALADNAAKGSMSMANIPKDLRGEVAVYLKDKGVSPGDIVSGVAGAKVVQATEKDFSPLGLSGRQIVAAATANNHLSAIEKAHQAMLNGDSKQFNAAMNAIGANTGNPAPTTFDAARRLVAPEIAKVIFGTGAGGVKEREGFAESFNRDMSPQQLTGTINQTKELFKGRLEPLANAYTYGTKKPFDWKGRGIEMFQPESAQQPVQQQTPTQPPAGIPPQTDLMAEIRRRGLVK